MTDTKHTPGPWVATYDKETWWVSGQDEEICQVMPWSGESDEPNARLIAAAPDLLEALEAMVAEYVDYTILNKLGDPEAQHNIKLSRAAIAKAKESAHD